MKSLVVLIVACGGQSHGHHHAHDTAAMAARLDDPSRDAWQQPDAIVRAMRLAPTMTVADVGAGTGYFTVRLARAVPQGRVIATDVSPELLRHIEARAQRDQLANVRTALASTAASGLAPASVDAVLVVHVWHHLEDRAAYARDLAAALQRGGRLLIVELSRDATHGPPAHMRLDPAQVIADVTAAGLTATLSPVTLPDQYIVEATR